MELEISSKNLLNLIIVIIYKIYFNKYIIYLAIQIFKKWEKNNNELNYDNFPLVLYACSKLALVYHSEYDDSLNINDNIYFETENFNLIFHIVSHMYGLKNYKTKYLINYTIKMLNEINYKLEVEYDDKISTYDKDDFIKLL